MKKLLSLVLSLVLVCSLAGCGKEQSATYVLTSTQEGVMSMSDTQTLKAKGDIVYEMIEVTTFDFSAADEASKAVYLETFEDEFAEMKEKAPESVTITTSIENDVLHVEFTINLEDADLQELMDGGYLMAADANSEKAQIVSFTQTCNAFEANGYTLQSE